MHDELKDEEFCLVGKKRAACIMARHGNEERLSTFQKNPS